MLILSDSAQNFLGFVHISVTSSYAVQMKVPADSPPIHLFECFKGFGIRRIIAAYEHAITGNVIYTAAHPVPDFCIMLPVISHVRSSLSCPAVAGYPDFSSNVTIRFQESKGNFQGIHGRYRMMAAEWPTITQNSPCVPFNQLLGAFLLLWACVAHTAVI